MLGRTARCALAAKRFSKAGRQKKRAVVTGADAAAVETAAGAAVVIAAGAAATAAVIAAGAPLANINRIENRASITLTPCLFTASSRFRCAVGRGTAPLPAEDSVS